MQLSFLSCKVPVNKYESVSDKGASLLAVITLCGKTRGTWKMNSLGKVDKHHELWQSLYQSKLDFELKQLFFLHHQTTLESFLMAKIVLPNLSSNPDSLFHGILFVATALNEIDWNNYNLKERMSDKRSRGVTLFIS